MSKTSEIEELRTEIITIKESYIENDYTLSLKQEIDNLSVLYFI